MNNSWAYLGPETDFRLWPIAGYLRGRVEDKVIVDLNCLRARMYSLLPKVFSFYFANDLIDHPERPIGVDFMQMTDLQFAHIAGECDVLLVLGYANSSVSKEESQTIDTAIHVLVDRCEPEIIVLEGIADFHDAMMRLLGVLGAKGYSWDYGFTMDGPAAQKLAIAAGTDPLDDRVYQRKCWIMTKRRKKVFGDE